MSDENSFMQAELEYGAVIRAIVPARIAELKRKPQSPIETSFLIGLMCLSFTTPCYDFGDVFSSFAVHSSDELPVFKVELQAPIENYRVDFLITASLGQNVLGKVVVECDGHAFHERTKEQAAHDRSRDRMMTLAGYTVLRFTGSELHRDLMPCVMDAHNAAWNLYLKTKP